MDVKKKLIDIVEKASARTLPKNTCHTNIVMLVNALIEEGVTVQEWKPISEQPKEKGTYLVCTDNGGVLLGHWYGTDWNAGGGENKHLAYWMERPQPLKGE